MKTLFFAAALLSLSPVAIHREQARPSHAGAWTLGLTDRWSRNDERWVSLQLERPDDRRWGTSVRLADLERLGQPPQDFSGDARFVLRRDAGTIDFEGRFADGRGHGTYRFTPSQAYIDDMRQMGFTLHDDDIFSVMALDVSHTFVRSIRDEGYTRASLDELVKMRVHGVTPAFIREIREAGYKDPTIEQLVRLRIHGVTSAFIREIRGLRLYRSHAGRLREDADPWRNAGVRAGGPHGGVQGAPPPLVSAAGARTER